MKRIFLILAIVLFMVGSFVAFNLYEKVMAPNMPLELPSKYVTISTNSTFEEVRDKLHQEGYILNKSSFEWTADKMKYVKNPMRAGRYEVKPGMSNRALIRHLRGGAQAPVRVVIQNKWAVEDVAGLIAKYLEVDSTDLARTFINEDFLEEFELTKETAMTVFIPDSYDFYWNSTPEKVFEKMVHYRDKFWTAERLAKAEDLNLTKEQVYTLASIVHAETQQNDEKDRVAGVYLNRLRIGMRLEADPTAKFASGNYKLNRVTYDHLNINSPYNTYQVAGLPPGPIYMASKSSINRTLDAEDHDYIYFCAKPGGTGYHAFAKSYNQHLANAAKYHAYAREQRRKKRNK